MLLAYCKILWMGLPLDVRIFRLCRLSIVLTLYYKYLVYIDFRNIYMISNIELSF